MYCSNCGEELNSTAKFCHKCGTKLATDLFRTKKNENSDVAITKQNTLSCLQRLADVLAQIETEQYYINLCDYLISHTDITQSGVLADAFTMFAHPIFGTYSVSKQKKIAKEELKKRGVDSKTFFGDEYELAKQSFKKNIQNIVKNNSDLAGIIPDRYLYSEYIKYLYMIINEGRANTINEAYSMLDDQIHRWNMESNSSDIQNNINVVRTYLIGW